MGLCDTLLESADLKSGSSEANKLRDLRGLVVLFFLAQTSWAATVVFDAIGPSNTVAPGPGLTIGGGILRGDPPGDAGVTAAEAFPAVPGATLGNIQLAVQYTYIAGRATGPANLNVSIAADAGNKPGVILETIALTNIFNSVPNASGIVEADSVLHPSLSGPGQYWIVVAPPDLLNTAFNWSISALTLTVPQSTHLGADPWPAGAPNQALAFRITAAPVSSIPTTPVPPTWILVLIGLTAVGLYETRRRWLTAANK
jgi:hypothetical protein